MIQHKITITGSKMPLMTFILLFVTALTFNCSSQQQQSEIENSEENAEPSEQEETSSAQGNATDGDQQKANNGEQSADVDAEVINNENSDSEFEISEDELVDESAADPELLAQGNEQKPTENGQLTNEEPIFDASENFAQASEKDAFASNSSANSSAGTAAMDQSSASSGTSDSNTPSTPQPPGGNPGESPSAGQESTPTEIVQTPEINKGPIPYNTVWDIQYDYQYRSGFVAIVVTTRGAPRYELLQEKNQSQQKEIIIRYYNTKLRKKLAWDIDASEFLSPIPYVRTREYDTEYTVDVVITLRDNVMPKTEEKFSNLQLIFQIPEKYYGETAIAQKEIAQAQALDGSSAVTDDKKRLDIEKYDMILKSRSQFDQVDASSPPIQQVPSTERAQNSQRLEDSTQNQVEVISVPENTAANAFAIPDEAQPTTPNEVGSGSIPAQSEPVTETPLQNSQLSGNPASTQPSNLPPLIAEPASMPRQPQNPPPLTGQQHSMQGQQKPPQQVQFSNGNEIPHNSFGNPVEQPADNILFNEAPQENVNIEEIEDIDMDDLSIKTPKNGANKTKKMRAYSPPKKKVNQWQ